jgi:hypothetical protein
VHRRDHFSTPIRTSVRDSPKRRRLHSKCSFSSSAVLPQHRHQLRPRLNPELPENRIQLRLDREHALAQPSRDRRAASGRATGSTFRAASPPYSSVNHKMTNRPSSRGSSPLGSARACFTTFHRPQPHLLLSKEAGPGLRPTLHAQARAPHHCPPRPRPRPSPAATSSLPRPSTMMQKRKKRFCRIVPSSPQQKLSASTG